MVRFFKIVVIALVSVVLLIVAGAGGFIAYHAFQPKTFDECMLAEMRGQDQSVIDNVRAVCQRRFMVMLAVDAPPGQWSWNTDGGYLEVIMKAPFSMTYVLSRAEVKVSPKDCSATLLGDWSGPITLYAAVDYAARITYSEPAVCLKLERLFAFRK